MFASSRFMRPAVLALLLALATNAPAITLVKDGQPAATIVIRESALKAEAYKPTPGLGGEPDAKVKLAAQELAQYLEKISGAKLPIVTDTAAVTGPVVLVGQSQKTAPLGIDIPHGLTRERREEGYVLVARGDALLLAGNDERPYNGTFYAVAELLGRLGVRWYMPSDFGEIIPQRKTIVVADVEFRDKPSFIMRSWWAHQLPEMVGPESLWKLHNKMQLAPQEVFTPPGDSSLRAYVPDAALAKDHPEYFAVGRDGKPDPYMPSLSHPDVPKMVADKVKAALAEQKKKGQTPNSIGFSPDDGLPMDLGPGTMDAINQGFTEFVGRDGVVTDLSVSEEWFRFVNKVVEEVVKEYPEVIFTANGYANRSLVPEGVALHPNLSIMFAPIWADTLKPFNAPNSWHGTLHGNNLKRWCEINKRVWIYGYNYNMLVSCLTPVPTVRKISQTIPAMHDWGVIGFADETRVAYMEHGIPTYYIRALLEWNAKANVSAVLDEFFANWYGPAAKPARAYWDALEARVQESPLLGHEDRILPYLYTSELLVALEQNLSEAEKLAQDPRHKVHVQVDRHILEHLKAYQAMHRAEFDGNYAEAVRQADMMFTHRAALTAISPFFVRPETHKPGDLSSGLWYWDLTDRKAHYQKLHEWTSGAKGELIAMAPREAQFALDPADLGKYEYWQATDYNRSAWRKLDCTVPFYLQGLINERGVPQYKGLMWYVWEVDIPATAAGKPVKLYAPVVIAEAWGWLNGKYLGHRKYQDAYIRPAPIEWDVTGAVKPGQKNLIAVRVHTGMNLTQAPDGFQGRLFLYSPK